MKRQRIPQQFHKDALHEASIALMQVSYDPYFDDQAISYLAYKHINWAISAWRRTNLLPVTITRQESPEPQALSVDELFGESLENFIIEAGLLASDPYAILFESNSQIAENNLKIQFPKDAKKLRLKEIVKMRKQGYTNQQIADEIGVTTRTIMRRIKLLREFNS